MIVCVLEGLTADSTIHYLRNRNTLFTRTTFVWQKELIYTIHVYLKIQALFVFDFDLARIGFTDKNHQRAILQGLAKQLTREVWPVSYV